MDPYNPDEFFRLPNDNAYTKEETREGPPLSYVAEKFRRNLEALHSLTNEIRGRVPKDLTAKSSSAVSSTADEEGQLLHHARYALKCGLVGYLALHNMLALANEWEIEERLLGYSKEKFGEWLDRIDKAGSVTG